MSDNSKSLIKIKSSDEAKNLQIQSIRDVSPVANVQSQNLPVMKSSQAFQQASAGMLTAYKDLNAPQQHEIKKQRQQMIFALSVFVLLGFVFLVSQYIQTSRIERQTASSGFDGFKVEGNPTHVEHYQYDKSCYTGANGEQVCMTRTSRK